MIFVRSYSDDCRKEFRRKTSRPLYCGCARARGRLPVRRGLPLVYLTVNGVLTSRPLGAGFGCNSQDLDRGRETFSFSATGR